LEARKATKYQVGVGMVAAFIRNAIGVATIEARGEVVAGGLKSVDS